jgi:hypothetical protein
MHLSMEGPADREEWGAEPGRGTETLHRTPPNLPVQRSHQVVMRRSLVQGRDADEAKPCFSASGSDAPLSRRGGLPCRTTVACAGLAISMLSS